MMPVTGMKLSTKLPAVLLTLVILVALAIGWVAIAVSTNALSTSETDGLVALSSKQARAVKTHLQSLTDTAELIARNPTTLEAMRELAGSWHRLVGDAKSLLRQAYIANNTNKPDQRDLLMSSALNSLYDNNHAEKHPYFVDLMKLTGADDILLLDPKGQVVYSVKKQNDFSDNFGPASGANATTSLGQAFAKALTLKSNEATFTDTTKYAPAGDVLANFIAAPIYDDKNIAGVIALRISPAAFAAVLSDRAGMGKTGDVVMVGSDSLLRSTPSNLGGATALTTKLEAPIVTSALAGTAATGLVPAPDGSGQLLAAAEPLDMAGTHWALVTMKSLAEAQAPVDALRNLILALGSGTVAGALIVGFLFAQAITKPVTRLTNTMRQLAEGNLEVEVRGLDKRDEMGEMARAVEVFRANGLKVQTMTEGEKAASLQRRADRTQMMQDLGRAFGEVVDAAVAGDFSKRVEVQFADGELNALAQSVNNLVSTVDRGLKENGEVLSALADTNLTRRVEGNYQGAFGKLKDDTNAMADKLTHIVAQLRETSGTLKRATGEILSGANDLSERTTKQAATIEETSAAMEQLAIMVTDSAKSAEEASRKTLDVSQNVEQGGAVMRQANEAMERITSSSAKISNIIGLIDDIAFQTNLLALNASVEAARAGEAGKGFAVVAVEVRRLAQSAAGASSEVKVLIEQSAKEVKGGSRLVAEASGKLDAMLTAVRENVGLINRIAEKSREQALSIEEVNGAVRRMDEMTQHNAALVEETNASIEQTEAQAVELDRIVEVFTLTPSGGRDDVAAVAAFAPKAYVRPEPASKGIRGMQDKLARAAKTYLVRGNAAVKGFEEF